MKTMKENAVGTWITLLSILLCAGGMVSYYILSRDGEKSPTVVYLLTALTIAAQAAVMFFIAPGRDGFTTPPPWPLPSWPPCPWSS